MLNTNDSLEMRKVMEKMTKTKDMELNGFELGERILIIDMNLRVCFVTTDNKRVLST